MAEVQHRWLGQVIETNDGLPFIGETAENQFVATGFCGNGFTLGTLAALMARDCFLKRSNPWSDLLDVNRKKLLGGEPICCYGILWQWFHSWHTRRIDGSRLFPQA